MFIKRRLYKTGSFVPVSLCIVLACFILTIIRGYGMLTYQSSDRSVSDGNNNVISHSQEPDSTATDAKSELIVNRPVIAELRGKDATATNTERIGNDEMKTILWYDTSDNTMLRLTTKAGFWFSQCKYKNCQYTSFITKKDTHPNKPFDADAILINGIHALSPPPRRDENQVFVLAVRDAFYCSEDDHRVSSGKWLGLFNWTLTYRLDSDFVLKYANIVERENKTELVYKSYDKIFEEKNNTAVWYVSHCRTNSRREHYVREMQQVMNIDIIGRCGSDPPQQCGKRSGHDDECHEQTAKKYKFYLAFENTFVEDYVTEKVFEWFNRDIIVVVRGGANYSRILPPGSVVDAGDFETPVQLGQYLAELAQDKVRYIEYLKRKDMYYSTDKFVPAQEANCKLCEYLNNLELHRKSYSNITEWWMKGWKNYGMEREDLEGWPRDD